MNFVKIKSRHIYLAFICLMTILFLLSFFRYRMHIETMESGELFKVRVDKVHCWGSKNNQNYFVFRGPKENEIVNVGPQICATINVGDSIEVLYNSKHDLYFPTIIDTSDDKWGMAGFGAFILVGLFYLFFQRKKT